MSKIVLRTVNREINVRGQKQTEWAVEIRQLTDSDLDHDDVIICTCKPRVHGGTLAHAASLLMAHLSTLFAERCSEAVESLAPAAPNNDADAFDASYPSDSSDRTASSAKSVAIHSPSSASAKG